MQHEPSHSSSSRPIRPQTQKGIEICRDYNEGRKGHADKWFCPAGRSHVCTHCRQQHPAYNHETVKGKDKGNSKGKNKDNGKDKGKGEGQEGKKGKC
jgi:hypothetical protein